MGHDDPVLGTKVFDPTHTGFNFTFVMHEVFLLNPSSAAPIDIKHSSRIKESEWYHQCRPAENTAALMEMPGLKPRAWAGSS